jgi:hypothetical protein
MCASFDIVPFLNARRTHFDFNLNTLQIQSALDRLAKRVASGHLHVTLDKPGVLSIKPVGDWVGRVQ